MKAILIPFIWVVGYLISLFLFMLIRRLTGEDPDDVYTLDDESNVIIYFFLILLWPLGLAAELLYFLFIFLRKWFVLIIETIVAVKEIKDEEEDEDNVDND